MTADALDALRDAYDALCDGRGVAVALREVISVQGPDAGRYLQGQLSQDVIAMAGTSAWSFILEPNGRVCAWLRVHRLADDEYRLEVEPGGGDAVVTRLRRFLLRTDATISEPETWSMLARRWSPEHMRLGEELTHALCGVPVGPGVAGSDALVAMDQEAAARIVDAVAVPSDALERYRIAHGVPSLGAELTEETIPGEAGAWVIENSVCFTKGCYTGQELVTRIHSRGGNVPKPIRLMVLDGSAAIGTGPAAGSQVLLEGAVVGRVTSSAPALDAAHPALALGPLARAVEFGTVVDIVDGERTFPAVVTAPPTAQ
jgi:folate-binding Fe-S cluster repair protein YgfZ